MEKTEFEGQNQTTLRQINLDSFGSLRPKKRDKPRKEHTWVFSGLCEDQAIAPVVCVDGLGTHLFKIFADKVEQSLEFL